MRPDECLLDCAIMLSYGRFNETSSAKMTMVSHGLAFTQYFFDHDEAANVSQYYIAR